MNPLTGGAYYLEVLSNKPYSLPPNSRSKEDVSSVVFSDKFSVYEQKAHEIERQKRIAEIQKKQENFMKRREANILKEAGRWQAVDEEYKKSHQNLEIKRITAARSVYQRPRTKLHLHK